MPLTVWLEFGQVSSGFVDFDEILRSFETSRSDTVEIETKGGFDRHRSTLAKVGLVFPRSAGLQMYSWP